MYKYTYVYRDSDINYQRYNIYENYAEMLGICVPTHVYIQDILNYIIFLP